LKKVIKILLTLLIAFLLCMLISSCGDSKDINQKSIFTAVALDKKGEEIYIYAEIANIESGNKSDSKSGSSGKKYIHVTGHGKTIVEARENLDRQLGKQPYLSATRTLILTENFAKEDLVEYLYRLRADELYRKKAITVITKEDPEKLFEISNEKDVSVGFAVEDLLDNLEGAGESFARTTSRLIENLSAEYTGFLIPCIGIEGSENSLIGYSVVNGTKVDGFIPFEDSRGIIFLKTDKPKFYYIVPYQSNKLTIEVSLKKRKIKPLYKDGAVSFDIKMDFEAKLKYGSEKTPYSFDEFAKDEVTATLTEILKLQLASSVEQAQKNFKCDYFQFDDEFRAKFPTEFEDMDWGIEFQNANVNYDVKVNLDKNRMMDYQTDERK